MNMISDKVLKVLFYNNNFNRNILTYIVQVI